jgi:UDP-3-O-[3-hydroxymyristoyl] glucosamine N-acyltransferase
MNKSIKAISLAEIKSHLAVGVYNKDFEIMSDKDLKDLFVDGVSSLGRALENNISFFSGEQKHRDELMTTKARACLVDFIEIEKLKKEDGLQMAGMYFVVVKDLNLAYAKLMRLFYPVEEVRQKIIANDAVIDASASIGQDCKIMHGVHIGKNVKIGDNVKIYPHVFIGDDVEIGQSCTIFHAATILNAKIGKRANIYSGARIGRDGFRYATDETGAHIRVPHIGRVIIGDDVDIGANTTIDRGSITDTVIGDMCKLDNLVQIGHNVVLGKGCFVIAQVGIAGSVTIGDYVAIGGQVGIADHITIGDYAKIAAQSGVIGDLASNEVVMGYPAMPIREFLRQVATIKKITKKDKI